MRIVFMGSAALAVPSLRLLLASSSDEVVGIVSQPNRPAGRKRIPAPCPLKAFAEQQGLDVLVPEKVGDPETVAALADLKPDLFVVVAYGQYIPSRVIQLAPCEAINVHPSLLPRYRGAAPIQWAILNGDKTTGVSIIYLAQKMDAGDIIRQRSHPIAPDDTSATLHDKLAGAGAELLMEALDDIRGGSVVRTVQDETKAFTIRKLNKEDGRIDWDLPAEAIRNRIRAFDPWPGSFCTFPDGKMLKVWKVVVEDGEGRPGEVLDDRLLVAAGSGALRLVEVQPSGGIRTSTLSYLNGHPVSKGITLE